MKIINVYCNKVIVNNSRLKYVIQFLNNHPLKNKDYNFELEANIGSENYKIEKKDENHIYLIPVSSSVFQDKNEIFKPSLGSFYFNDSLVYGLSSFDKEESVFCQNSTFSFDIFETIFFFISRYEEYYAQEDQLDQYGRMKSSEQLIVKNNLHQEPIVDQLVFAFFTELGIQKEQKTTFTISSDIDVLLKYPNFYRFGRNLGRALVTNRSIVKFVKTFFQYMRCKFKVEEDPYNTFDWLLREDSGFEKDVYFMTGGQTKEDNLYKIQDATNVISIAQKRGYNIGIHPSFNCVNDIEQLEKEKSILGVILSQDIIISRQHFLRFDFKKTINDLVNQGVETDSTLGFSDIIGFRCGTGYPYYLYDFNNEKTSKLLEKPLVVMDVSLLRKGGGSKEAVNKMYAQFLSKNDRNTHITFNFHNSSFDSVYGQSFLKPLFLELINRIKN